MSVLLTPGPTTAIAHTPGATPRAFLPGPATPVSPMPQSADRRSRTAIASSLACASVAVGLAGVRPSRVCFEAAV
eukprot:scaffold119236_cov61-Phaeocystis_antarctica.AAC.4